MKFEPFDYDRKNKLDVRTNDCKLQLIWSRSKEQTRRSCKPGEIMARSNHDLMSCPTTERKFFIQLWWDKTENNQNHKIFVIKTARTLRQITKTLQNLQNFKKPHLKTKNIKHTVKQCILIPMCKTMWLFNYAIHATMCSPFN